jgi:hypothetical protein
VKGLVASASEPVVMTNHERHIRELISLGMSLFERQGFVPSDSFQAQLAEWRRELVEFERRRLGGDA